MEWEAAKSAILAALGMAPELAARVGSRRAEVEAWLDDFLQYNEPETDIASSASATSPRVPADETLKQVEELLYRQTGLAQDALDVVYGKVFRVKADTVF